MLVVGVGAKGMVVMERLEVEPVGAHETALTALRLIAAGNSGADCCKLVLLP